MSTDLTRIVSRLSEIDRMQTNLLAEKDELLTAKRVLERLHATAAPGEHPRSLSKPDSADSFIAEMIERNDETNKALFLRVLRDNSSPWMSANEIKETASRLKGRPIPMASISPTLTQLKLDGIIVRDGLKVALGSRLLEIGASASYEPTPASILSTGDQTGTA